MASSSRAGAAAHVRRSPCARSRRVSGWSAPSRCTRPCSRRSRSSVTARSGARSCITCEIAAARLPASRKSATTDREGAAPLESFGGGRKRGRMGSGGSRSACDLATERERLAGLFAIEDEARAGGHLLIAGVDEVGRGCLAGPVYAGAVVFDRRVALPGLDDSKALVPEVRESLASRIREVARGAEVGAATAAEVDAIGIVAATLLAMRRALDLLRGAGLLPSLVLVDAARVPGLEIAQRAYVRGAGRRSPRPLSWRRWRATPGWTSWRGAFPSTDSDRIGDTERPSISPRCGD